MAKRGESIVEVVVACGVLSMLFAAVAGMIVSAVSLNDDARHRMEAVFLAQKELNKFIVEGDGVIDLDSASCKLVSSGGSTSPGTVDTAYYPNSDYAASPGCKSVVDANSLSGYLNLIQKNQCQYIWVRPLNDGSGSNPDETSGNLVDASRMLVIESHVKWVSRALGYQEYVIRKLVQK